MQKPHKEPAVYYSQDALSDYATKGGSILDLFYEEINSGNIIVIEQKPVNAPPCTLAVLKAKADVDERKKAKQTMEDWLFKALNTEPPAQA